MADLDKVTERSARGSFHLFIGNLISEIANAVGIIIVARLLTPEDMGARATLIVILCPNLQSKKVILPARASIDPKLLNGGWRSRSGCGSEEVDS